MPCKDPWKLNSERKDDEEENQNCDVSMAGQRKGKGMTFQDSEMTWEQWEEYIEERAVIARARYEREVPYKLRKWAYDRIQAMKGKRNGPKRTCTTTD